MQPTTGLSTYRVKRRREGDLPIPPTPGTETGDVAAASAAPGSPRSVPSVHDHPPPALDTPSSSLVDRPVRVSPRQASASPTRGQVVSVTVKGEVLHERALLASTSDGLVVRLPGDAYDGLLAHEVDDDLVLVLSGPAQSHGTAQTRAIGLVRVQIRDADPQAQVAAAVTSFRKQIGTENIEMRVCADTETTGMHIELEKDDPTRLERSRKAYGVPLPERRPRKDDYPSRVAYGLPLPEKFMGKDDYLCAVADAIIDKHSKVAHRLAARFSTKLSEMPNGCVFVDPTGKLDFFEGAYLPVIAPAAPLAPAGPGPGSQTRERDVRHRPMDSKMSEPSHEDADLPAALGSDLPDFEAGDSAPASSNLSPIEDTDTDTDR